MSTTGKKKKKLLKIQMCAGFPCGSASKTTNAWRLINTFLNNQQITEEIKKEIKICIEINENMTTRNLEDSAKAGLRGRFIAIQAYLKQQEKKSNK